MAENSRKNEFFERESIAIIAITTNSSIKVKHRCPIQFLTVLFILKLLFFVQTNQTFQKNIPLRKGKSPFTETQCYFMTNFTTELPKNKTGFDFIFIRIAYYYIFLFLHHFRTGYISVIF